MAKFKTDSGMGCVVILLLLSFGLACGFGIAAFLTWLLSLLGVLQFSWFNAFIVWIIMIVLGVIFGGSK